MVPTLLNQEVLQMRIKVEGSNLVFKIPKNLISRDYVERFMERIELEMLVGKSQMADSEAWELSEKIKQDWWKENKDRVLKRVKK
jgi:hypothetical protein